MWCLLYADDLVVLAESAQDLQVLLCHLEEWCNTINAQGLKEWILHLFLFLKMILELHTNQVQDSSFQSVLFE